MKVKLLCGVLALSAAVALQGAPRVYDAKMPRKIQIARDIAMMPVKNGKVNFEIVCTSNRVAQ